MAENGDGLAEAFAWECPRCGGQLPSSVADGHPAHCPHCGAELSPPTAQVAASPGSLDYALPETPPDRQGDFAQELDGLRIRQVATLRRGTARARSYLVIGVTGSVVTALNLVWMTVEHVRAYGWNLVPVGYLMFAVVVLALARYFGRRALALHRELQAPAPLPPIDGEPDFSTLSDGSQHWKNLEDIR